MSVFRIHIQGSLLCKASGVEDSETFEAVLDAVLADHRVHHAQIETLEIQSLEEVDEADEALVSIDVADIATSDLEDFEEEHGLEIFDCATWPDDLVRDLLPFLDAWSKGRRGLEDYELLQMARGLGLLGLSEEDPSQEELTDRGRLLVMGWVAQKGSHL